MFVDDAQWTALLAANPHTECSPGWYRIALKDRYKSAEARVYRGPDGCVVLRVVPGHGTKGGGAWHWAARHLGLFGQSEGAESDRKISEESDR